MCAAGSFDGQPRSHEGPTTATNYVDTYSSLQLITYAQSPAGTTACVDAWDPVVMITTGERRSLVVHDNGGYRVRPDQ